MADFSGEVTLREVEDSDLPTLFEDQRDPEVVKMAAFPPREREAFMAHWGKIRADPINILRTILYNGQVAGSIVSWIQDDLREGGYGVGREFWGRGIATQALRLFLQLVEDRPLYGYTAEHNLGSMRVLEKCGFVKAGESKGVLNVAGELVAEVFYRLD
ncbi:MAG: GNAT family protein [Anaerolineales bacterium]